MIIKESQLDEWVRGNPADAQKLIVELIWRLVEASCPNSKECRFPLDDSVNQHGPDGYVDVDVDYKQFVPQGCSIWEIGTGIKPNLKANADYIDRIADIPFEKRIQSTFIFVTPLSGRRSWEYTWKEKAQNDWLDKHKKENQWKDIIIIDGTKLTQWISFFPAIGLWLTNRLYKFSDGQINLPINHWQILRSFGAPPPLIPDLFLSNRNDACTKILEIFNGQITRLKFITLYPDYVIDFVSTFLASWEDEKKANIEGKCLIISSIDAWKKVCSPFFERNHILVADPSLDLDGESGTRLIQMASQYGHSVIFGGYQGVFPEPNSVPLPSPSIFQIQESLVKAGYTEERARILSIRSNGNLSSLLRIIQNLSTLPAWSEGSLASELSIALLLGSWDEIYIEDQKIIETLSGKPYGEWIKEIRDIALSKSTPLIQQSNHWKFIPRFEGWYSLGSRIFNSTLDVLKTVSIEIFCEKDPKFELPSDKHFMAEVYGKKISRSNSLRKGLAETLALLGNHQKALINCSLGKAESTATLIVKGILTSEDPYLWASLNDLLPLFAEAAPNEFLSIVESHLESKPSPFVQIFGLEGKDIFGNNYMTGLLWALETLAWDSQYLSRVVLCLGKLATLDPGGQWLNRPTESLHTIFLPWMPQTCATIDLRISSINMLLADYPEIGWKILIDLLPSNHSVSSGTRRPAWMNTIPDDWHQGVTRKEYLDQIKAYIEIALKKCKKDVTKIVDLINLFVDFPPEDRKSFLEYLESDEVLVISENERLILFDNLTALIKRHRGFPQSVWAMGPELIDEIEKIAQQISPKSPFLLHQRIFGDIEYEEYIDEGSFQRNIDELKIKRKDAIKEIFEIGGLSLITKFVKEVASPIKVGFSLGTIETVDVDSQLFPDFLDTKEEPLIKFINGYIIGKSANWDWVEKLNSSQWSVKQKVTLLTMLPFRKKTWEHAKKILNNDESQYWINVNPNQYEADPDFSYVITKLLSFGRPLLAIRCIAAAHNKKIPIDNKIIISSLQDVISSSESWYATDRYDIEKLIIKIHEDNNLDPLDIVNIEWLYFPLLNKRIGLRPVFLYKLLSNNAEYFCKLFNCLFRDEKKEHKIITEDDKKIAEKAYQILSEWDITPGIQDDNSFDVSLYNSWISVMKGIITEQERIDYALSLIGHTFTHISSDPDGFWISHSAAKVLDMPDAKLLREGFLTEALNSRGFQFIDPTGKPEFDLAEEYRSKAEKTDKAGYPHLASTLRDIAKRLEEEGKRNSSENLFDD